MTSVGLCHPCQDQDKHVTGVKWCPECEVNLCSDCVSYHKSFKTTKSHNLVDINAALDVAAEVSKQQYCIRHAELKVEYFCTAHDELSCHACLAETHKSCEKVFALDIACKDVSSRLLDDSDKEINYIGEALKSTDQEMKKNACNLKDQSIIIDQKISEAKAKAVARLDEWEANLRTELQKKKVQSLAKINEVVRRTKTKADQIEHRKDQITFVQKHGTNKQAFVLFHHLKTFLFEVDESVSALVPNVKILSIEFEEKDALMTLPPSKGSISVIEKDSPVGYTPFKQLSAQCVNMHPSKPFTSYNIVSRFTTSEIPSILGMTCTTNGKLLMCNFMYTLDKDRGVLVYSENGQYIQTITINCTPYDIAEIPGRNQFVVTLPLINSIQFIDSLNLKPGKCVNVKHHNSSLYGVTASSENVYIGDNNRIHVLTVKGSYVRIIMLEGFGSANYLLYKGSNLYACVQQHILCINQNDAIQSFRLDEPKTMRKIVVDSYGYFYVGGKDTHKVHRLTKELKPDMTIDDASIKQVTAICFNGDCTKLYVASNRGLEIVCFSCS